MSENVKDYVEIWRDFQPHEYLGMTDAEGAMAMEIGKLRAENARLRAEVAELEQQNPVVAAAGCQCPPGANMQCANHWCPRKAVSFRVTSGSAP